eukprot:TRINITY_DN7_c1_g1_i1.p1 TRINITY_DN7_c1_g1~~TRINITY_DN7_c1_g1_i1.p1  ORF type:complete len:214 (+),score=65.13 TRINITY_DN7_c1_g1_i1:171-812(+)
MLRRYPDFSQQRIPEKRMHYEQEGDGTSSNSSAQYHQDQTAVPAQQIVSFVADQGGEPGTSGEGQVMMEYTVETVKMEATAPSNAEATDTTVVVHPEPALNGPGGSARPVQEIGGGAAPTITDILSPTEQGKTAAELLAELEREACLEIKKKKPGPKPKKGTGGRTPVETKRMEIMMREHKAKMIREQELYDYDQKIREKKLEILKMVISKQT